MVSFAALPGTLIAFLLASPTVFSIPTTPNDPFHALSLHSLKQPDHPVCCLTPLQPVEPIDDDVLLSFEEWKAKQFAMQTQAKEKEFSSRSAATKSYTTGRTAGNNNGEPSSDPVTADAPVPSVSASAEFEENYASELLSPHFRVPLTDRFNYASLDCSARVHTAHRSAKSPSSILSSKKDRYMLSPCGTSKGQSHFVVVELCEDIRIDTVQLANFEFFSGVFKDFTVSVAKTYTTDAEGWTVAGAYKAKNVRGVQSFHPPTSLRDFYRYIRIDFHSHYSNEYYCPISLLRVYGLTHLEQWKWDIWEAESRAKRDELEKARAASSLSSPVEVIDAPQPASAPSEDVVRGRGFPTNTTKEELESFMDSLEDNVAAIPSAPNATADVDEPIASSSKDTTTDPSSSMGSSSETSVLSKFSENAVVDDSQPGCASPESISTLPTELTNNERTSHEPQQATITDPSTPSAFSIDDTSPQSHEASPDQHSSHISASEHTTTNPTVIVDNTSSSRIPSSPPIANSSPSPIIPAIPFVYPPPPPAVMGGESIYRTIMNRLTALEANHTLYARYVEEQTAGVRDMLKRLGEEVGRLEGIRKAQAQMYQRTVKEWERQRHRLEMEHGELISRVDYLADEIVVEKRLGIAQLCLLLAVLVFMGLTRGSRGEALPNQGHATTKLNSSMREWSRRHLSFSSDWTSRFRSRSLTPQAPTRSPNVGQGKVEFPSSSRPSFAPPFTSRTPLPHHEQTKQLKQMHASAGERRPATAIVTSMGKRSRTPTSLRTPVRHLAGHHRPMTPTSSHLTGGRPPHLQRTNSQGNSPFSFAGVGPVPRSAKKFARSSHLHEVRVKDHRTRSGTGSRDTRGRENDVGDIFRSPLKGNLPNEPITVSDALTLGVDEKGNPWVFSAHRKPLSSLPVHSLKVDDNTENDIWVDTDADGSELDLNSESDEVFLYPAVIAT